MSSGRTNSQPTLTWMTGIVNEKTEPSDQVILNDMNVVEFNTKPVMWPVTPTHPPTIQQNMVSQDARQKELMDAYYKNDNPGTKFTMKYPCRPSATEEYEDCGPYGANIPCYSNGEVKDNRMILKDCCKLPEPTAATNGTDGANCLASKHSPFNLDGRHRRPFGESGAKKTENAWAEVASRCSSSLEK